MFFIPVGLSSIKKEMFSIKHGHEHDDDCRYGYFKPEDFKCLPDNMNFFEAMGIILEVFSDELKLFLENSQDDNNAW